MPKLPNYVLEFMKQFSTKNYQMFLVGGPVRDLLLGREIKNWDFTTSAKPEEMTKMFPDAYYNNIYGTVTVPLKVDSETYLMEVTTFRKEGKYTDTRHPDEVVWAETVEEDLSRRDFTINAMAYDGKTLVDPFDGQKDLENKLIKAVGDPDKRFAEDALRLMRGVRLASQLGFLIDETTRESMKRSAQLITKISWERIHDELLKTIGSEHPSEGILFLRSTGILKHILPEVDICFAVPQKSPKRHHIYDVGTHLVMALKHCPSKDPITRLATLLHDIGKAGTFWKDQETGLITFHNHEVVGANQTRVIANRLKLSNKDKDKLISLVAHHQFTVTELMTDKAIRRFIRDVGLENIQDMLDLRTGDRIGSGATPTSWRFELFKKRIEEVQHEPFAIKDLKVDGHDVMELLKIKPGPQIGEVLKAIFAEVEDGKLKNEREMLLERLKTFIHN